MSVSAPPMHPASPILPPPPGAAPTRLHPRMFLAIFVGVFVGIIVLVVLTVALQSPDPGPPPCPPDLACGNPPTAGPSPLVSGTLWRGSGVQVEYDDGLWTPAVSSSTELRLQIGDSVSLWIQVRTDVSPRDALSVRLEDLRATISDLTRDTAPEHQILGPNVGYLDGVGAAYGGSIDSAQGAVDHVAVAALASSDGDLTVVVSAVAVDDVREAAFAVVDSILNTLRWPAESQ